MGLGLPILAALNVSQFRAILAHEFAHYYGGDTSLGPWLLRTRMAMIRTFRNIGSIGRVSLPMMVALLYTAVVKLLHWYWLLFLRAINFVSRQQEYRADELACIVAGPVSLVSGLRGVHASALAWPTYWKMEVAPILNSGRLPSITDGFAQFLIAPSIAKGVKEGLDAEVRDGKADPYDSHPPLCDRITAADRLSLESPEQDRRPAWLLLGDINLAELNFLHAVNPDLPKDSLQRVSWEESASAVIIPSWIKFVAEYADRLQGMTIGNLPETLGRVPQIGADMRDPKGMLLTPEQRVARARHLVSTAFALALVNNGWTLHSLPGVFHLEKNGEQLQPFELIVQISDGMIRGEAWTEMCSKHEIGSIELAPAKAATIAPSNPTPA